MKWLELVHEEVKLAESPRSFVTWAALAAIAAIAKRNVYIRRKNIYRLYPNIFILIVGPSGVRKSLPVRICRALVNYVGNTRVIDGQNSIQGVVHTLSKADAKNRRIPLVEAHGLLLSEEFSNFLLADPTSLTILTTLYDTHDLDEWKKTLKGSQEEILQNVCLTLFGATNDDHFKDRILDKDIKGGFMARTLCVYESKMGQVNPLLECDDEAEEDLSGIDYEKLGARLIRISELEGKMRITRSAYNLWVDWYKEFIIKVYSWDRTGISRRIHDHILKTAILLSLADRDDLIIDFNEMKGAFDLCLPLMRNTEIVLRGKGKSDVGPLIEIFLDLICAKENYTISRAEILGQHYVDFSAATLGMVTDTMQQGGRIELIGMADGPSYRLSEQYQKIHKQIVSGEI